MDVLAKAMFGLLREVGWLIGKSGTSVSDNQSSNPYRAEKMYHLSLYLQVGICVIKIVIYYTMINPYLLNCVYCVK